MTTRGTTRGGDKQQFIGLQGMVNGWIECVDTQYSEVSPLALSADTDTLLTCNDGAGIKTYAPEGIDLFDNGKITGIEGELRLITTEFKCKPTSAGTTYFETFYDIGGAIPPLYRRPITFPKGNGVERNVAFTTLVFTLNTWEANGADFYGNANGPLDVYDLRHVIYRPFALR